MRIALILDPLDSLKPYKDTSLAIMREAAGRGHELFVALQSDLFLRQEQVRLRLQPFVETFGTETIPVSKIQDAVLAVFDLRPAAIIRDLDLLRPIYALTSAYGHFGRELPEFTWEATNRVDALRAAAH